MELDFLPLTIKDIVSRLDLKKLYNIRLRINYPIIVNYENKIQYLSKNGTTFMENKGIICTDEHIRQIISSITEKSIYAYNDKIKQGYLTSKNGVRVGLAGECVYEKELITIKNITSLNIRIPHEIQNASNKIFPFILNKDGVYNSLIISPPSCGKTTILKDVALKLNDTLSKTVLIIDERGEFERISGKNIDSIKYSNKLFAFEYALRSMAPDVVITDELVGKSDWEYAYKASLSGVNIIASCHGQTVFDVVNKEFFKKDIFSRYFVLKGNGVPGVLEGVFDKDFNKI